MRFCLIILFYANYHANTLSSSNNLMEELGLLHTPLSCKYNLSLGTYQQ